MANSRPEQFFADILSRITSLERRQLKRNQAGQVVGYVGTSSTAPSGTVWANGAILNIVDYPRLFAEFGTTYGGNGTTTFGVPNIANAGPVRYAFFY